MGATQDHSRKLGRRLSWVLIPAVLFLGVLGLGVARKPVAPGPGDPAPELTGPRLDGNGSLSLAEFGGRPVLINFWASWCGPCRDEAPMLSAAHRRYGNDVAFIGIDVRDDINDARAFATEVGMAYPSVRDDDLKIYDDYGLTGQPETFLITAGGKIFEHVNGPFPSRAALFRELNALIGSDG